MIVPKYSLNLAHNIVLVTCIYNTIHCVFPTHTTWKTAFRIRTNFKWWCPSNTCNLKCQNVMLVKTMTLLIHMWSYRVKMKTSKVWRWWWTCEMLRAHSSKLWTTWPWNTTGSTTTWNGCAKTKTYSTIRTTHPHSSWLATWVTYNAVLLWLLQVGVLLRVLWGYSAAIACAVASVRVAYPTCSSHRCTV